MPMGISNGIGTFGGERLENYSVGLLRAADAATAAIILRRIHRVLLGSWGIMNVLLIKSRP
jgi:hypothetical protein